MGWISKSEVDWDCFRSIPFRLDLGRSIHLRAYLRRAGSKAFNSWTGGIRRHVRDMRDEHIKLYQSIIIFIHSKQASSSPRCNRDVRAVEKAWRSNSAKRHRTRPETMNLDYT